jgi:hypothetical protein
MRMRWSVIMMRTRHCVLYSKTYKFSDSRTRDIEEYRGQLSIMRIVPSRFFPVGQHESRS